MNECVICLVEKNNFNKIWICQHEFCVDCCNNISNSTCPLCREKILIDQPKKNKNILDINFIRNLKIPHNLDLYLNKWSNKTCLDNNHEIVIRKTYGVIAICVECNIIQCFNYINYKNHKISKLFLCISSII